MSGMNASMATKCSDQTPHPNTVAAASVHGSEIRTLAASERMISVTVVKLARTQMLAARQTSRRSCCATRSLKAPSTAELTSGGVIILDRND